MSTPEAFTDAICPKCCGLLGFIHDHYQCIECGDIDMSSEPDPHRAVVMTTNPAEMLSKFTDETPSTSERLKDAAETYDQRIGDLEAQVKQLSAALDRFMLPQCHCAWMVGGEECKFCQARAALRPTETST